MIAGRAASRLLAVLGIALAASLGAPDADARGGRGGGGRGGGGRGSFSRSSPARGGSFVTRSASRPTSRPSTRPSTRPAGDRPDFSGRPSGRPGGGAEQPTFGERPGRGDLAGASQRPSTSDRMARPSQRPGAAERPSQRPERPTRPDAGQASQKWQDYKQSNREDWQGFLDEQQGKRQDALSQRQEDRQEFAEDFDWDEYDTWESDEMDFFWGASFGFVTGMVFTSAAMNDMSCTMTPVTVDFVGYYRCGPTWYTRTLSGGDVTYVVVNPPPGY